METSVKRIVAALGFQRAALLKGLVLQYRLRHIIIACVLVSVIFTEFLVVGASYFIWTRDQFDKLKQETLLMLKANAETTAFPTVDQIVKIGERIAGFSAVRGGAVYNSLGEMIASFGQSPSLTMRTFQRENIAHFVTKDQSEIEVFYSQEMTGFANPIILRIDARSIPALLMKNLEDKAVTTLIVGFISSLAIAFLLGLTIVRPVLQLRNAVSAATDNPNLADRARLNWKRRDEFGEVAKALDLLFTTVSVVYQEDLAAGQDATQRAAFAVLNYGGRGQLIGANEAALLLFDMDTYESFSNMPSDFIRVVEKDRTIDVPPLSLMKDKSVYRLVNVVTKNGIKRCIFNGVTVHNRSGAVLRTIVTLIDITSHINQIDALKNQVSLLEKKDVHSTRRLTELRALFQSCLILLTHAHEVSQESNSQGTGGETGVLIKKRPVTLTDRIVNAWYYEASHAHLVNSEFSHEALPPAYGTAEEIEAVFRQAFMYIYARARVERPSIRICAKKLNDAQSIYEIWEEECPESKPRALDANLLMASKLSLASLQHSLRAIDGELESTETNKIKFILYTASFGEAHSSKNTTNHITTARS